MYNLNHIDFELTKLKLPIIIIIGPPGAGKTAVGMALAKSLNWNFYDTDILIGQATAMKIAEIFAKYTEAGFRQLEKDLLNEMVKTIQNNSLATESAEGTIISCGGGLPIPRHNFANLATLGKIVCLNAPASVLTERIGQKKDRPLLNSLAAENNTTFEQLAKIEKLLAERKEIYAKAPHQIDTSDKNVDTVVNTIRTLLEI